MRLSQPLNSSRPSAAVKLARRPKPDGGVELLTHKLLSENPEQYRDAAVAGIRDDVVLLALSAAEKVTKKSLSGDDHRKMVEEALADADLSGLQKA